MPFFGPDPDDAGAPWERKSGAVRISAELTPVLQKYGLAPKIRAADVRDPPRYPPIVGHVDGAWVTIRVEERKGVWVREVSVQVEARLPDDLTVRALQAREAPLWDRVTPDDPELRGSAYIECMDGSDGARWLRRNQDAVRRIVAFDAELSQGFLYRVKSDRERDVPWIDESVGGLLEIAGMLG
ncbi:MAG: hypothetical protein H6742_11990 [Alphaproteobacteria bacterium]|nr:hypothetical protein [Alphaproteobacteria bacterium]